MQFLRAERTPSIVPIHALAPLVAFLRLDRQRGDRARLEPPERDRLAGFLAVAVGAVLEPLQRSFNLADQLALALAGAQFNRPVGLRSRAVRHIRVVFVLGL